MRRGIHPRVAQTLARHCTITLTMDRDAHTVIGEQATPLAALPELTAHTSSWSGGRHRTSAPIARWREGRDEEDRDRCPATRVRPQHRSRLCFLGQTLRALCLLLV